MESDSLNEWELAGGVLPDGWGIEPLESLLASPTSMAVGVMYPGGHVDGGIPLVKVGDVSKGMVRSQPVFRISELVDNEYKRSRLHGKELLITLVGNPGDCVVVSEEMSGWNVARALAVLHLAKPDLRRWIQMVFQSRPAIHIIESRLNTTVQRTLNLKDVRQLPIPLPPENLRNGLCHILGSLDDKIELNRQMNATLEEMAQALFQSWFVDFDPVIDKALAAGNEIPEQFEAKAERRAKLGKKRKPLPPEIAALFPDAFVETEEMGFVPEGWEVKELGEIVKQTQYGYTESSSSEKIGPHFLRITDIQGGKVSWSSVPYCTITDAQLPKYQIQNGDIFVARTGNSVGENVFVLNPPDAVFASYLIRFQFPTLELATCISKLFRSSRFAEFIEAVKGGSAQPNANAKVISSLQIVNASIDVVNAFHEKIHPLDIRRVDHLTEIETLTQLRDTLLPKLISGEIRLKEAEAIIEKQKHAAQ